MPDRPEVPSDTIARIAAICLALPAAYEEQAWAGTRWMIGKKNFAHAVRIEDGWPPAYAQAAGTRGPATVLTFRSSLSKTEAPELWRRPFFKPVWFDDIFGLILEEPADWRRVQALLRDSYAALAPKKLLQAAGLPASVTRRVKVKSVAVLKGMKAVPTERKARNE